MNITLFLTLWAIVAIAAGLIFADISAIGGEE
jgi:hypothetical protein